MSELQTITNKIYIPTDNTINYIGLIIGPRGRTQKNIENETQCSIKICGSGSAKIKSDQDEPLHVLITGTDSNNVEIAASIIEKLINLQE
jgi:splicing factor 1